MKFSLIVLSLCFCMIQLSNAQFFRISGKIILDPNGKEFMIRGINSNHADWDSYDRNFGRNSLKAISSTGANLVRVVWKPSNGLKTDYLKGIIEEAIKQKLVVMVEYHDATGSPDEWELTKAAQWWKDNIGLFNNYKRYVIINIANEWSPFGTSYEKWRDAYKKAIGIVRSSGWEGVLVVDGSAYAQNSDSIIKYGQEVLNSDPKKNIAFSLHMYAEWKENGGRPIGASLEAIQKLNLAVIIGEFTRHHPEGCKWIKIDTWEIMRQAQAKKIGWIAWSWHGNGKGDCDYKLDEESKSLNMVKGDATKGHTWTNKEFTEFGNIVMSYKGYSIPDTSVRASVF